MKNNSNLVYSSLLVIGDFLALLAAFGVAYILRVNVDDRPLLESIPAETYLYGFFIVLPLWILIHASIGLYSRNTYENRFTELGKLIVGSFLGILVVIGYDFTLDDTIFPARLVPVYGFVLGFLFLIFFRTFIRIIRGILFSYDIGTNSALIIGGDKTSHSIVEQLINTRKTGYKIVGIVGEAKDHDLKEFSSFNGAVKSLGAKSIHSIIQTELYKDEELNEEILSFAQNNHINYRFIPRNDGLFIGNIEVELFRETPVISVHQTPLIGWGRIAKRIFDFTMASLLLLLLSPLLILVAILVKISGPRSRVLFRQKRLTQFNKPFRVYKFRSFRAKYNGMSPEAAFEAMGKPELSKKYRDGGDMLPDDPRISKLGKILRAASIDELPQLINVVKGDLSLVGPRALVPEELDQYQQKHHILSVKSGITGLAQVSGRRDINFEERRKLDLYYVQHWSFWLDIIILLKTVRAVLGGHGAK